MPKQCYQMWQNVAKGVQRGFKRSQGVPNCSKGSKGFQRESATRCGKKCQRGSKGKCYQMWQKVAKGVPKVVQGRPTLFAKAYGLEPLPAVLARRARAYSAPAPQAGVRARAPYQIKLDDLGRLLEPLWRLFATSGSTFP